MYARYRVIVVCVFLVMVSVACGSGGTAAVPTQVLTSREQESADTLHSYVADLPAGILFEEGAVVHVRPYLVEDDPYGERGAFYTSTYIVTTEVIYSDEATTVVGGIRQLTNGWEVVRVEFLGCPMSEWLSEHRNCPLVLRYPE